MGKHFEVTLNDVAVAIVDEAVHRYLGETGRDFPHRLIAMLPVSLRNDGVGDGMTMYDLPRLANFTRREAFEALKAAARLARTTRCRRSSGPGRPSSGCH